MKRRSFLIKSSIAGSALAIRPRLALSMRRFPKSKRYMRLDSHIHLYDGGGNIDMIGQYFIDEGLTHGQVIVRTKDLHLLPNMKKVIGPGLIPFEWPLNPLKLNVDKNVPVLGYKIHLRKPVNYMPDGSPVTAASKELDPICNAAEKLGRPFLFHSDADAPEICTMPQMAELAQRHPDTAFIAAHTAAYTQEFQGDPLPIKEWEAKLPGVLKQNFDLLLNVKNLYADTVLIGRDYPERSANPRFKLDLMIRMVANMSPAKRKALIKKLFIGTDFPWFYNKDKPTDGYYYQVLCMKEIFGRDFNETQTTKNIIALLPENERARYLNIYKTNHTSP